MKDWFVSRHERTHSALEKKLDWNSALVGGAMIIGLLNLAIRSPDIYDYIAQKIPVEKDSSFALEHQSPLSPRSTLNADVPAQHVPRVLFTQGASYLCQEVYEVPQAYRQVTICVAYRSPEQATEQIYRSKNPL